MILTLSSDYRVLYLPIYDIALLIIPAKGYFYVAGLDYLRVGLLVGVVGAADLRHVFLVV